MGMTGTNSGKGREGSKPLGRLKLFLLSGRVMISVYRFDRLTVSTTGGWMQNRPIGILPVIPRYLVGPLRSAALPRLKRTRK